MQISKHMHGSKHQAGVGLKNVAKHQDERGERPAAHPKEAPRKHIPVHDSLNKPDRLCAREAQEPSLSFGAVVRQHPPAKIIGDACWTRAAFEVASTTND